MSDSNQNDPEENAEIPAEDQKRREILGNLGKWSGASVMAAIGAVAWIGTTGSAQAGWINRRGGWLNGRGGWVNGRGGGGSWVNRRGGGGWVNRR